MLNSIISYTRQISPWRKILGILSLASAFALLAFDIWASVLLLAFGLGALQQDGLDIDLEKKTYRTTYGFLQIRFGKWKALPDIEYVSVFRTFEKTRVWVSSASTLTKNEIFVVNLFYERNKKLEGYRGMQLMDAFEKGLHFSEALDVRLLDATTNDFEWVDLAILKNENKIVHTA